ncbi:hypothetical protein VDGL01_03393 [Verticillium dahliae]
MDHRSAQPSGTRHLPSNALAALQTAECGIANGTMDGNELVELWLQRVNDRPRNTRHDRHRTQRRTVRHGEHLAGGDGRNAIGQNQKHSWADDNPLPPNRHAPQGPTRDHVDTTNGSLEDDSPQMPAFEKRARHKTRHDKYDLHGSTKMTVSKSKAEKIKRPSRRRETSNRMLLASREVMDKFAPEAVHNSRVTLQPANTPGLFHNGRHATQQIQDLGHGSMEIASSHEHRPAKKRVPSRSRDRKHKKRGRELDEASDIFRRPILQGDHQQVQDMGNIVKDQEISGYGYRDVISDQPESRSSFPPKNPIRGDRPSTGRNTSYCTWSTSDMSTGRHPGQQSHQLGRDCQRSLTPDHVQQALQESGALEGAGVSKRGCQIQNPHQIDAIRSGNLPHEVEGSVAGHDTPNHSRPNTVIVRYEDKGVMARELSLDREARIDHSVAPEEMHEGTLATQAQNTASKGIAKMADPVDKSHDEKDQSEVKIIPNAEALNGELSRDEVAKQIYLKSPAPKPPLPVSPGPPRPQRTVSLGETPERYFQSVGDYRITRPLTAPVESTPGDGVVHLPKECPAVPDTESPADAQSQSQLGQSLASSTRTHNPTPREVYSQQDLHQHQPMNDIKHCAPHSQYAVPPDMNMSMHGEDATESVAAFIQRLEAEVYQDECTRYWSRQNYPGQRYCDEEWFDTIEDTPHNAAPTTSGAWYQTHQRHTLGLYNDALGEDRSQRDGQRTRFNTNAHSRSNTYLLHQSQNTNSTANAAEEAQRLSSFWRPNYFI